jgi:hypothetical protein
MEKIDQLLKETSPLYSDLKKFDFKEESQTEKAAENA